MCTSTGHFGRIVDHDETIWNPVNITYGTNKVLSFKDPKTKQTVPILDMLFKIYPVAGILPPGVFPDGAVEKFNGGIIFCSILSVHTMHPSWNLLFKNLF